MQNFDYEKRNTITTLKNEIYGLKLLNECFKKISDVDFSSVENKVVNIKVQKLIQKYTDDYILVVQDEDRNEWNLRVLLSERYNTDTKSYVKNYDSLSITLGTYVDKKSKCRFDRASMLAILNDEISKIGGLIDTLENELQNIDDIVKEYAELYDQVKKFRQERTFCFRDNFKALQLY